MIVYDLKFSSEFLTCPDNPAEETKYLQKKKKILPLLHSELAKNWNQQLFMSQK